MTDKTVTQADIHAAAIQWCGEKERETSCDDIRYFESNWKALPGLRERVEKVAAARQTDAQMAAPDGLAGQLVALRESEAIEIAEFVWQNFDTILASLSASNAMRDALEKNREGWLNAIEMGLLPKQHYETARILADECLAALAGQGTTQKDTSHG